MDKLPPARRRVTALVMLVLLGGLHFATPLAASAATPKNNGAKPTSWDEDNDDPDKTS